ncbi:hypothetical protein HDU93_009878, partial [Gonapodya sp. JEL0774]
VASLLANVTTGIDTAGNISLATFSEAPAAYFEVVRTVLGILMARHSADVSTVAALSAVGGMMTRVEGSYTENMVLNGVLLLELADSDSRLQAITSDRDLLLERVHELEHAIKPSTTKALIHDFAITLESPFCFRVAAVTLATGLAERVAELVETRVGMVTLQVNVGRITQSKEAKESLRHDKVTYNIDRITYDWKTSH